MCVIKNIKRRNILFMYATLTIILLSAILVALSVGRYNVKVSDIFKIIVEKIVNPSFNSKDSIVIIQMRIPRIFTSILVGAGLSVSGVTFQGMFQNKLVSPDISSKIGRASCRERV